MAHAAESWNSLRIKGILEEFLETVRPRKESRTPGEQLAHELSRD